MALPNGETLARDVAGRIHRTVATIAALTALPKDECVDGCSYFVQDGSQGCGSSWRFVSASSAADTTSNLVVTPTSAPGGVFLRDDELVDLKIPVAFGTTDAAVLFTVPAGFRLFIRRCFWEVTTGFTGGAASTIGLSSDNSAYSTKGDLLGGAAGDAAAVLISTTPGPFVGAAGAKTVGAAPVVLVATNVIRFDRITSAFTAGAGFAHVIAQMVS